MTEVKNDGCALVTEHTFFVVFQDLLFTNACYRGIISKPHNAREEVKAFDVQFSKRYGRENG